MDKILEEFNRELREAALSFDVEQFKSFFYKWKKLGVYTDEDLPKSDKVLEITLRKMAVIMTDAPEEKREEAKAWLTARGYTHGSLW